MKVLFFLCLCAAVALAVEQVIEIPIENRLVHKDVLKMHQARRIAKWGGLKMVRSWPKYHQKLLEGAYRNDYLFTNISFGTPNQDFVVMLSSGGTRAWVLDKSYAKEKQHGYDSSKSSTSISMGKDFDEQDGGFNITGKYYTDHMQFGKAKIKNQPFGVVNVITEENDAQFPIDGVLGFNHLVKQAYTSGEPTAPIDNLMHPLIKKFITVYMGKAVSPSQGTASGLITIGGFDSKHCDESATPNTLKLFPSTLKDNRYVLNVTSAQYGSIEYTVPGSGYFDTSFSNIILPSEVLQTLYSKILPDYDWDTGLYTVPCDSISDLQPLYIVTRESYFVIYAHDYAIDLGLGDNNCALALEMNNSAEPESYIIGTPAARSLCTVLDYDTNTISLYPHAS